MKSSDKTKTMKTQIKLMMNAKIVTATALILVAFSGIVRANEPEGKTNEGDQSYYDQAEFMIDPPMVSHSLWISENTTTITETEESVRVEKWMVNIEDQSWGNYVNEATIHLEKWMIDTQDSNWSQDESEAPLILEDWMNDLSSWVTS